MPDGSRESRDDILLEALGGLFKFLLEGRDGLNLNTREMLRFAAFLSHCLIAFLLRAADSFAKLRKLALQADIPSLAGRKQARGKQDASPIHASRSTATRRVFVFMGKKSLQTQ